MQAVSLRLEMPGHASTSVANSVRVVSSRETSSRSFWCALRLQPRGRRLRRCDGGTSGLFGMRYDRGRLRLALPLRLVDELLCQQKRSLQRLVGERSSVSGGGSSALVCFGGHWRSTLVPLELRNPLARLAEPLVQLADVLLEPLGLLGSLVQVLIHLVDVVALQAETELHGAKGVEN